MRSKEFDVIIIGAGISGIGAAYHLQKHCPGKRYAILEGRSALGGTWDKFRYPGIRSDSSMLTMAFEFKPWPQQQVTAEGHTILNYLQQAAVENGIDRHIIYEQKITQAAWSSDTATWTLLTEAGEAYTCNFLLLCAGYYDYKKGFSPNFKGIEQFNGHIIHPQDWPEDLDYAGKRIVVIGSGATAVTMVPALAKQAEHVVMLQRSPTYMRAMPDSDPLATAAHKYLPTQTAYRLTRWQDIGLQQFFYWYARNRPKKTKQLLLDHVREELPAGYDIDTHFTPRYNPWDQRICLVPNSDLFQSIHSGSASIMTAEIEAFVEDGILLTSGRTVEADIIVTATGLNLEVMGGIQFEVDNDPVDFAQTVTYKGIMVTDVPNMVATFGYINASWTLRVDLTARYVCRVLNHMSKKDVSQCTPRISDADRLAATKPYIMNISSGYMQRSMHLLPKQGETTPWVNTQSYFRDKKLIGRAPIDDGHLVFE